VLAAGFETFVLRALLILVALGVTVLVSRLLGPEGRGIYYVAIVASAVLVAFAKLGLEQANVFLVGTRTIAFEHLAAQNLLVSFLVGGSVALLFLAAPAALPAVFSDVPMPLLMIAGLAIPLSIHTQLTAGLQSLAGQVTWQFRAAIFAGLAQLALLLVLNAFSAINLTSVMLATLVGSALTWLLTLMRSGHYIRIRWNGRLLRETLGQSLVLHVGMLLFFLHLRVDMFMVKGINGATELGQYSLAVVLAETVLLAPDSVSIALLPRQMGNTLREAALTALRAARLNGAIAVVIALGWLVVGPTVISTLFGREFLPAFAPLVALLPGMVFLSMQRACGAPALRTGRPGWIVLIYSATLACNVGLNFAWIPELGATGAGLASSISYGVGGLMFLAWCARLADVSLATAIRPTKEDYARLRELVFGAVTLLRGVRG
jgi:O-antigen/teichoic acid export membrane protein